MGSDFDVNSHYELSSNGSNYEMVFASQRSKLVRNATADHLHMSDRNQVINKTGLKNEIPLLNQSDNSQVTTKSKRATSQSRLQKAATLEQADLQK